jgi:hypothetical protein
MSYVPLKAENFSDGLRRNLCNFRQRILAGAHFLRHSAECVGSSLNHTECDPGILAITADLGFYACVLNAACSWGWTAEWACSMGRGLEVCRSGSPRIVIYDRNLPGVDWRKALDNLSAAASQPRILLAAQRIDEDLWRTVLRRRGYDVLSTSATSDQLKRELRFAWLSLDQPNLRESAGFVAPALSGG